MKDTMENGQTIRNLVQLCFVPVCADILRVSANSMQVKRASPYAYHLKRHQNVEKPSSKEAGRSTS